MKIFIINSLKNFRGIYRYSINLYNLIKNTYPSIYITRDNQINIKGISKLMQLAWEIFFAPIRKGNINLYSYPRLPLKLLLKKKNYFINGIIIYDFMQSLNINNKNDTYIEKDKYSFLKFIYYFLA